MKFLIALSLFFSINSIVLSQKLRFDGLYLRDKDPSSSVVTNDFLRFYEHKKFVISATSTGSPHKVSQWLNLEKKSNSKGKFKLKGETIAFSLKVPKGLIKYSGTITNEGKLILEVNSLITGKRYTKTYSFIPQASLDKPEVAINKSPVEIFSYEEAETKPIFIGGTEAMFQYISTSLVYPKVSLKNKTEGLIYVRFVIEKDGSCSNPQILRGLDEPCNRAVIKLINDMPDWSPGKNKENELIRSYYVLPIKFTLPSK